MRPQQRLKTRRLQGKDRIVGVVFILTTIGFLSLFLQMPLAAIFAEAFLKGAGAYLASFNDRYAGSAIRFGNQRLRDIVYAFAGMMVYYFPAKALLNRFA